MKIKISFVLGSYQRKRFLELTIESLRHELAILDQPGEIIVVDGGSTDGSIGWLTRQKDVITVVQHNRGIWKGKQITRKSWGYFMNLGFRIAKGKYICMVSDDCLLVPGSLKRGIEYLEEESIGRQVAGGAFFWRDVPGPDNYWVGSLHGDKVLINHGLFLKQALEDADYINEEDFRFYYADSDLCLRLWEKGYDILICPDSYVEHFSHANFQVRQGNSRLAEEDATFFKGKWGQYNFRSGSRYTKNDFRKTFKDPAQTSWKFRRAGIFNYHLVRLQLIKMIRSKLKKINGGITL